MTALHFQTLAETCRQLKSGERSSVAVTEYMLARIAEQDETLASFAKVLPEQALTRAAELDRQRDQGGELGVLHGVPIAIKDLLFTEGLATASGTIVMAGYKPAYTATVVERLVAAGAVIIGKTQLTEGAFGSHHPEIPPPKNPYDLQAWAGVSSSGSGVSVAAGLAFGALGTDTGGSIRFPSGCCGLVGIKPTYGRVSRYGAFPLAESLDHIGPMTRTVEDSARMLAVIAGVDANDASSSELSVPNYAATKLDPTKLRIGVDWQYVESGVDQEIIAAVRQTVGWYRGLGVEIVEVKIPSAYEALVAGWGITTGVECAKAHAEFYPALADQYGPGLRSLIDLGIAAEQWQYDALEQTRTQFSAELDQVLAGIDGLLIPTMPVLPRPSLEMEGGYDDSAHAPFINFTAPFDYSGHPTITLPTGLAANGLPNSVQLVGKSFEEETLVGLGYLFEAQRGGMPPPPGY